MADLDNFPAYSVNVTHEYAGALTQDRFASPDITTKAEALDYAERKFYEKRPHGEILKMAIFTRPDLVDPGPA